jgi:two-component system, sensor histidine kinase and response regulator
MILAPIKPARDTSLIKCLLVDDLEENLLALSALLRREDIEVFHARSGIEALELLLVHDFALAFLDVQMPEMDGFALAEVMRGSERSRHVPIIFVTAAARDQERLFKGYDSGAVDFIYKPIEPRILANKAEVFFQLHRQKQQLAKDLQVRTETLLLNEMFTAVLGHDLRNPLNAILMSCHLLAKIAEGEEARRIVGVMRSSGERMKRMIDDILDLARMRLSGGLAVQRERTSLDAVVNRVVREHQMAYPDRTIEVAQQGDFTGVWDTDRLAQVASNLIGNALSHGDADAVVQIGLDGTESAEVVFSVDNAGAIPAELLPNLFDPFRRAQQRQARGGGLGLGLYIVQQIVLAHGGRVEVQVSDAEHTVFRVVLPRQSSA